MYNKFMLPHFHKIIVQVWRQNRNFSILKVGLVTTGGYVGLAPQTKVYAHPS